MQTHDLTAAVDGHVVLTGVDLDLPSGGVTALVGANGSGKSTLLRTLAGIAAAPRGHVVVGGDRVDRLRPRERALRIALVAQEDSPPDDLLVGEMIALGRIPHARPWSLGGAEERQVVLHALAQVGLQDLVDRPCHALSGGERRRALLARGLAQDAPVLLLDEPTNHLDVAQQHQLLRLARAAGRTVVMAIHDLDLAHRYADHVVVVGEGSVLDQGPPATTLTGPAVAHAFGIRASTLVDPATGRTHLVCDPPDEEPIPTNPPEES
ncbi:ABC transporter ATP-binding protein [Arsenicicoccus dermatophilus]|uniref:ABC transporter ATP-binding protein n=1 Tax=Arsenicicoccus dermatophilus TaxID=1076331 RepID=UPI001F4D2356|nr:ABC transporter ATP-binding protein [Arsenicicoccus dermatophilus]MCH8614170.1 ABC transporter ATP-binding protein [Arsenicicoccus dermatophilus]